MGNYRTNLQHAILNGREKVSSSNHFRLLSALTEGYLKLSLKTCDVSIYYCTLGTARFHTLFPVLGLSLHIFSILSLFEKIE
jgi:hypothetical protein